MVKLDTWPTGTSLLAGPIAIVDAENNALGRPVDPECVGQRLTRDADARTGDRGRGEFNSECVRSACRRVIWAAGKCGNRCVSTGQERDRAECRTVCLRTRVITDGGH